MKKSKFWIIVILIILVVSSIYFTNKFDVFNSKSYDNITTIDMLHNRTLSIEDKDKVKLNIKLSNDFPVSSNKFYTWKSSNKKVAIVDNNGIIQAKNAGTTTITAKFNNKTIKTKLTVYKIKQVIIVVGDSRMDHFKDDNEFKTTSKYEIKYAEKSGLLSNINRFYVVSLSGMRYNWLAGEDNYKDKSATKYVKEIINEYEDKTNDTIKYNIKILFNLGVNDLANKYLDTPASDVANKYLNKLDENMNNEWKSNKINKISLNMITLFPVRDKMIDCYFPGRYNKDVIEFNNTIKKNSKYPVCDAYNDLDFKDEVFRERHGNDTCATRDGLHFTKEFNKDILYPYLVDVCAKK